MADDAVEGDVLAAGSEGEGEFGADGEGVRVGDKNAFEAEIADFGSLRPVTDLASRFGLKPGGCAPIGWGVMSDRTLKSWSTEHPRERDTFQVYGRRDGRGESGQVEGCVLSKMCGGCVMRGARDALHGTRSARQRLNSLSASCKAAVGRQTSWRVDSAVGSAGAICLKPGPAGADMVKYHRNRQDGRCGISIGERMRIRAKINLLIFGAVSITMAAVGFATVEGARREADYDSLLSHEVAQAAQGTSSSAHESMKAAQQLAEMSTQLRALLDQFKLNDGHRGDWRRNALGMRLSMNGCPGLSTSDYRKPGFSIHRASICLVQVCPHSCCAGQSEHSPIRRRSRTR